MTWRIRTTAVSVALVLLAALLQGTIGADVHALHGEPDMLCLVIIPLGLVRGPIAGAVAGWSGGLLLDILAWQPLGLSAIVYTLLGYSAGHLGDRTARRPVRPLVAIAVGTVAARVALVAVAFLVGVPGAVDLGAALSAGALSSAAFDVLIAIPLYPLLRLVLSRRAHPAKAPPPPPLQPSPTSDDVPVLLA